jgi:hypothetical protein
MLGVGWKKRERGGAPRINETLVWWNAGASRMNQAHPKRYFERLGLISLEMKLKVYQS